MDRRLAGVLVIVLVIILGLLSWPQIVRTVEERGLDYPKWGGHIAVLRHFRQILRDERDPDRRVLYRRWLWMTYAASFLVFLWFLFVLMGAVGRT